MALGTISHFAVTLPLRSRKDLYRKAKRRNLLLELDFEEGVDEFGSNIIGILRLRYASIEPIKLYFPMY